MPIPPIEHHHTLPKAIDETILMGHTYDLMRAPFKALREHAKKKIHDPELLDIALKKIQKAEDATVVALNHYFNIILYESQN